MRSKPPSAVVGAVMLYTLSFLLGYVRIVIKSGWPTRPTGWMALVIFTAIVLLIARALYRGRNWLRIVSLCLTAFGIAYMPWSLAAISNAPEKAIHVTQGVLQAAAAILLLTPAARGWFRPNNSSKPTPLRGAA
jgi:hypothetical protein